MSVTAGIIGILVLAQLVQFVLVYALALRVRSLTASPASPNVPLPLPGFTFLKPEEVLGSLNDTETSALVGLHSAGLVEVAILSPSCQPCRAVADQIKRNGARGERLLVIAVGDKDRGYSRQLAEWTSVINIEDDSALLLAFGGIDAFPTLLRTTNGTVIASDYRPNFLTAA